MKDVSIHKCILHIKNRPNCLVCFRYIMLHCNFVTIETMTRSKNVRGPFTWGIYHIDYTNSQINALLNTIILLYQNTLEPVHWPAVTRKAPSSNSRALNSLRHRFISTERCIIYCTISVFCINTLGKAGFVITSPKVFAAFLKAVPSCLIQIFPFIHHFVDIPLHSLRKTTRVTTVQLAFVIVWMWHHLLVVLCFCLFKCFFNCNYCK